MECRKGRRKGLLGGLLLAWLLTSGRTVVARNIERYDTAYACEGKTLWIECGEGKLIHLIRANYGRFSITICNEHGNTDWSVNCMSPKTFRVLNNECNDQQNCSIVASTSQFGDPCPNTHKYLEAHYRCVSATTTTTTSRPSPPWFITSQPSVWSTAKPTVRPPSRITTPAIQQPPQPPPAPSTPALPITTPPSPTSTRSLDELDIIKEDQDSILPEKGVVANGAAIPPIAPETMQPTTTSTFAPWRTSRRPTVPSTYYPESSSNGQWYDYGRQACPPVIARNLSWNATRAGDVAVQSCPGGANGLARWRCLAKGDSAVWHRDTPDLSECRSVWLTSLENRVTDGDVILGISRELSQVTNNSRGLYGGDMMITTKIIKNMAEKMAQDIRTYQDPNQREVSVTELLQGVVRTGSNLLNEAQMASWKDLSHQEQMRVATSLLIGLEENAFLLADTLTQEKTITHDCRNILMEVRVLDTRNIGNDLEVFPNNILEGRWTASTAHVELTRGALLENSEAGIVRLVFMAFNRLEEILQPQAELPSVVTNDDSQSLPKRNTTRLLNSKIISASLGKGRHIQLSEPVRIYFRHLTLENVTNPTCVFWDYILSGWSEEGCQIRKSNDTHTVCECNHLTNFAVLMDVHAVRLDIAHQVALQIITYIGCIISVVCLVLAILTFQLFRGLKSDRTTIHKNLCVCLLIAEVLFVCGIGQTNQRIVCGIVAGLLHFFFLCAFAWMFLEGFQLYVMLIEVFEAEKSRLRWYYLVAYGAPLLVVAISCIIDPFSYGTDRYCWLRADNYFIFSFVGPVILVILANLVFLSMAIYMMCRHANTTVAMKSKEHSRLASASGKEENALPNKLQAHLAWLRGAIVLVFLLGLTWTFGLLYLNQESVVMAYIFTVLNSLQGLFIFVFHCVQNEKVRKEYRKFIRRHSWLPKCLRCSKTVTGSSGSSGTSGGGVGPGGNGGKEFASHNTSSNPSAPTTDSSGLSPHAASNYLVSGRSWAIVDRQPAVAVPSESSGTEAHIVATLPYARHAFLPSAPNIPKSATATWGHLNKNLMWKNISFKSYSRDSGHGGSEQEDSPRTHNTSTLGHSGRNRDRDRNRIIGSNDGSETMSGGRAATTTATTSVGTGRRAAMPYNHTYTEIVDGRNGGNGMHHQMHAHHGQHVHLPTHRGVGNVGGLTNEDDPVYEEIERGGAGGAVGEIQVSDMSDEDGRRQSDMSRQSSRSYGDHRPLIPYSPANDRNLLHYGQTMSDRVGNTHYDPTEYGPTVERTLNACWEKLRRQQARYELGELPRLPAGYGLPPQQDHTRTVAVLDGHTVVCHLQPQTDMYTGRGMPPPSYSEC
ncbi:latrophilin Cirl-like isoform X1 [Vespa velutina]|uniref:latrophilin Cirl-like isoform X1 n=1 Tax=Vespa velutina TaxID=202808 RepID=UPI001FB448A5|nr:latrophilin Cirl-like isoform X1 [Vespa velutina]XP_047349876.1 latrophilin Cirl-like isoform X1 [Vespa velutina]XP_047349877.1 latrophilin Cirl-like isoform X1 [Vespa velutina]XP_047349878.1 latrophilin Cirl-like isoform X1 [Vespa velutina]XP_047349879.1 latrophilin Cirl-like isoform X1 [Vespa velutina]XP_047349881.1 latrophilin Cirl-like isoform X1 [Vespa velutina]XP_047349882.1 latrophilin Cirl-like isoform X1 [Vespa velutina]XP_047349883.1 latrophilin Cirl-like isoform X1 [Vespa velut